MVTDLVAWERLRCHLCIFPALLYRPACLPEVVSEHLFGKKTAIAPSTQTDAKIKPITSFSTRQYESRLAAEITDFNARDFLDNKKIMDFSKNAKLLCSATKLALSDASITITNKNAEQALASYLKNQVHVKF